MFDVNGWQFRRGAVCVAAVVLLSSTACQTGMSNQRHATATLLDSNGREVGVVHITDATGASVGITGAVRGLVPGEHGIHLHAVGSCVGAGEFASAGGHFNPSARKHGLEAPDGPHAGDLPNLSVGTSGAGTYRATSGRVTLGAGAGSLFDADGSAVVVHAALDDQRSDPSGNSGARIACGVVTRR